VTDEKAFAHDEHRQRVVFFPSRKICLAGLEDNQARRRRRPPGNSIPRQMAEIWKSRSGREETAITPAGSGAG
jgi:hypothetical protein